MASVWRAVDQTLDRPVAIKFLFIKDPRGGGAMVPAFLREARIAAAVRHRNVVDILDFGTDEAGIPFMVMELLEGETVQDRISREGRFTREEIFVITARVLQGLAAVHDAGIIHRDLKPGNIFLVRDRSGWYPKLLDFGISRSVEPDSGRASAVSTVDGNMVGTPEYMSCEQARGQTDIDRRTDIYSMGVILYELLTGRLPFRAAAVADLIVLIMTAQPPRVHELCPEVGLAMSDLVARAMERDRELRFADVEQMHAALIAAAEEEIGAHAAQAMSIPPAAAKGGTQKIKLVGINRTVVGYPSAFPPRAISSAPLSAPSRLGAAPQNARNPRRWGWVAAGSAATALVLIGASIGISRLLPKAQPSASTPRYIVVKGAESSPLAEPVVMTAPSAPGAAGVSSERASARSPSPARGSESEAKKSGATKTSRRSAISPEARLAQAFAQQKAGIEACFSQNATELEANSRLSVRVKLNPDGKVAQAEILPEPMAKTALGGCIARVTKTMVFSPQPEAISFRIPLTARRE